MYSILQTLKIRKMAQVTHNTGEWQVCPKCKGLGQKELDFDALNRIGVDRLDYFFSQGHDKCNLCNVKMVVSIFTGKPPAQNCMIKTQ